MPGVGRCTEIAPATARRAARSAVYLIAPSGWVGMRDRINANLTTVITTIDHYTLEGTQCRPVPDEWGEKKWRRR